MSFARAVGRNTLIQFISKLLGTALGLVTIGLLQRYLAPAGFGAYTTAMAYLGFFSVVADLGLYLMLIRELAKPGADEVHVIGNILGLRWVSAAVILLSGVGLVTFMPYSHEVKMAVAIGAWSFLAVAATQLLVGIFQTKLAMGRVAVGELAGRVVLLITTVLVVQAHGSLAQVMLAVVSGSLVNLLIVWLSARRFARFSPRFDWPYWQTILRDTWPVAISIVLNLIYFRIDTIFLSLFADQAAVGLYGAAYKILEILNTFPLMFVGLLLPALGAAFAASHVEDFQRLFQKGFDLLLMAALPLVVGGWIFAEKIVIAIGADAYGAAGPILRLLLIAVFALFMNSLSGHAITIINRQRQMVWGYVGVALIGVAAYLILIPRFSYFGAATGTIITESLSALIGYTIVLRVMHFHLRLGVLPKVLLANGALALIGWTLRAQPLWIGMLAAAAAYGVALIGTRALTLATIRDIVSRQADRTPTLPTE